MKVAVIGVGHVGLVTAATLAYLGHDVVGLDDDTSRIESLRRGEVPFFEPGLPELLDRTTTGSSPARRFPSLSLVPPSTPGSLTFETDYAAAIPGAQIAFICVGTPARPDGEANLAAVETSAREAVRHANGDLVIVQKSTVPVMTSDQLKKVFQRLGSDRMHLASNPEFLREGSAVSDSLRPDRILVGAEGAFAHDSMRSLYKPLIDGGSVYVATDLRTAELAKHACNAFLATKISFANALARISDASGADVMSIADIMGLDGRIGRDFLNPGPGFGGYCLPKDVLAFKATAKRFGYEFGLLDEVVRINAEAMEAVFRKIQDALWNLENKKVLLLGLAFKAGTDDIRESPSLKLARKLIEAGGTAAGFDPHAGRSASAELEQLATFEDPYEAADGADCVVICTRSPEFAALDLPRLKGLVRNPLIVDACNLLDPRALSGSGFTYLPNGRPPVMP